MGGSDSTTCNQRPQVPMVFRAILLAGALVVAGCGGGGSESSTSPTSPTSPGTTSPEVAFTLSPTDLGAGDTDGVVETGTVVQAPVDLPWAAADPSNLRQWDEAQVGTAVGVRDPCTRCQCVDYVKYRIVGSTRSSLNRSGWGGYGNFVAHRIGMAEGDGLGVGDVPRAGAIFHYFLPRCGDVAEGCSHTGIVESAEVIRDGGDGAATLVYRVVVAEQNYGTPVEVVNPKRTVRLDFPTLANRKANDFTTTDGQGRRWRFVYTPTGTEANFDQQAKDLIATWWDAGRLKRTLDRGGELSLGEYQQQPLIRTIRLLRTSSQRDVAVEVVQLFQSELGRGADIDGLLSFLPFAAAGETVDQIKERIRSTDEYQRRQAGQRAPTIALTSSTGSGVETSQQYLLALSAADVDGDLSRIDINWGDGTAVSQTAVRGSQGSVEVGHSFQAAGTYSWSATAIDARGVASQRLTGTVTARAPTANNRVPTLSVVPSTSVLRAGDILTITVTAADLDANLSRVSLSWGDGSPMETKEATGSATTVSFSKTFTTSRSMTWSATVTDTRGATSTPATGTVDVRSEAVASPTLSSVSPNPVNAGTTKPFAPTLTLSGTNLNTVTTIRWLEQGSLISTWTKQSNGTWTTSTGFTATVTQSATSLVVQPTVVAASDTWSGSRNWTVTVGNGTAEASRNFIVSRSN